VKRDPDPQLHSSEHANAETWRSWIVSLAMLAVSLACLVGWYWGTAASMVEQWRSNETFAHGFLIVPISVWLIWERRKNLSLLRPQPTPWPLLLMAGVGFGWLLADLAEVQVVRQYAFVLMIPLAVWTILGNRVARAITFPLVFLIFAVPFGEFLLPPLMQFTADFAIAALRLTGIPVYREGLFFTIPTGSWSVVEACSGLRYLIASITLGCLYAYLTYRSWKYRLIFVGLSFVVPLIANGLRAYLIVMIGHLSNMQLAVGVDHLIYGWLFFGLVMLLLFWAGSFWREDLDLHAAEVSKELAANFAGPAPIAKILTVAIAAALLPALWPAYAARVERKAESAPTTVLHAPTVAGWQLTSSPAFIFTPNYLHPRATMDLWYEKNGQRVGLFIAYYNNQNQEVKLVSSQNKLVTSKDQEWGAIGFTSRPLAQGAFHVQANETHLRGSKGQLLVWDWLWVDGKFINNPYLAKWLQAKARLLGGGDDGAVIVLYAPFETKRETASEVMQAFLSDALPAIEKSLIDAHRN
jgi:exosortase A